MGVNAKVVQELLGHSNIAVTLNIYSHVLPSMHQDAMSKMDTLFAPPPSQEEKKKGEE